MLVDKKLIDEAKQKMGENAAHIIAKDLGIKEWDEINLKGCCFNHEEKTPSLIWNPKENCFHCFGCSVNYGIIDHYMAFYHLAYLSALERLFKEQNVTFRFSEKGLKSRHEYVYPIYKPDNNRDLVDKYLATRGISKETLTNCDVQQYQGKIAFNFYDENEVLLTVKLRPSHTIDKHSEKKETYLTGYSNTPILYNMNRVDPSRPLVITEGELDCLSIIESGYSNCVSVPCGADNLKWIEECWDWLERFENITVFGDNDNIGIKMRREVVSRLGAWRTKIVDLPKTEVTDELGNKHSLKDANDVLMYQGKEVVLTLIATAEEMPLTGVTDLSTIDDFDLENAPGLKTNLEPLDKIVYKFLLGNVVIVTGLRGSGKSTLINQVFVCNALHQELDVFVFSGELSGPLLKSWIELTMAGPEHVTMKDEFIHIIEPEAKTLMREWYKSRVWVYDDLGNSIDHILEKAITLTRKYGTKIWVLDNLMTLDIGANDTNLLQKQKDFIVKLTRMAQLYNVLIVLAAHPRKVQTGVELGSDDIEGSGGLGNMAQYLMSVKRLSAEEKKGEQNMRGGYKRGKEPTDKDVEIRILKNRMTGKVDKMRAYFDYKSYRFHCNVKEAFIRYEWDKNKTPLPSSYPKGFITEQPDIMED